MFFLRRLKNYTNV